MLATITFKGAGAGTSPVPVAMVELGADTRLDPQPMPAATQDGQVTVAFLQIIFLPLVVKDM